jgi:hypothetical protein
MSWPGFLQFEGTTDGIFRAVFVFIALFVLLCYSSLFEEEYHQKLAELYLRPWWRFMVVFLVVSSAIWCPRVGILVALIAFLYLHDMNTLITPFPHL